MADVVRYFLSRAAPGAISFFALAVYTRLFSPEAYGRFSYVMAFAGFFHATAFRWLQYGLQRFYQSSDEHTIRSSVVSGAFLLAIPAFLVSVVAILAGHFCGVLGPDSGLVATWGILILLGYALFELVLEAYRAELRPWSYGGAATLRAIFAFAAIVAFSGSVQSPRGLFVGTALSYLLVGTAGLLHIFKSPGMRRPQMREARQIVAFGSPLVLVYLFNYLITTSDRLLISAFLSNTELAHYSVAYDLVQQSIVLLFMVVNLASFPQLVRIYDREGEAAAKQYLPKVLTLLIVASFPLTILFVVNAEAVSRWYVDKDYSAAVASILPPIGVAMVIAGIKAFYFDNAFLLTKHTKHQILPIAIAGIINVLANLLVIPRWGILGAAWTTLASYAIACALSIATARPFLKIPFPRRILITAVLLGGLEVGILAIWPPASSMWGELARCSFACAAFLGGAWLGNLGEIRSDRVPRTPR